MSPTLLHYSPRPTYEEGGSACETHHSVVGHRGLTCGWPAEWPWLSTKIGGPGPNTLKGTNEADHLLGNGGNDVLYALGGRDNLLGEEGKD